MPMQIIRADITRVSADAIVNSANRAPTYAEGVDSRIYEAAGATKLLTERKKIGYLEVGEVCVTPAFALDAKYIFHVSSPRWIDGNHNEVQLLRQCYDKALLLALEHNCKSIAIPLLATGHFRFPQGVGLEIATNAIREFLYKHELNVILVVFNRRSFTLAKEITNEVKSYIDENYVGNHISERYANHSPRVKKILSNCECTISDYSFDNQEPKNLVAEQKGKNETAEIMLLDRCQQIAPTPKSCAADYGSRNYRPFSDYVIQLMNKKGIEKASEVYTACGISKQLWSKMMNPTHSPSKNTVMLLCIGLKLNLDEAYDLMLQAGYAFSPSKKLDVIVEFCISKKMDIYDTNNIIFNELGKTLSYCG